MSVFSLSDAELDDRLAQIPALDGPAGGGGPLRRADQPQRQGDHPDGVFVARCSDDNARGARHRPGRRAREHPRGGRGGCRCPGRRLPARPRRAGDRLRRGRHPAQRRLRPRRDRAPGRRGRSGSSTRAHGSSTSSTCSSGSRATAPPVATRATGSPTGTTTTRGSSRTSGVALAVRDEGTVPCNNDLLAENFIDDGDRIWLIDYEYSGNNDPCFELGNTWTECKLSTDQLDELVTAYYGRRRPEKIARAHLQAIVSQYGWALWGFIQQAVSPLEFDFWGWGMERFEGAVEEMRAPGFTASCSDERDDRGRWLSVSTPPDRARVVVIGGGVIGTSVAYHLTKLGWEDVVLLEQGQLSSGTTWHAAGLVGQLRASESGTRLVQYSVELYAALEEETGLSAGYKQCGGVTVARTPERMVQLRRTAATADAFGMECVLLTPEEALERYPVMQVDDLEGAIWLPGDGKANPTDLTNALAKGARNAGRAGLRAHPGDGGGHRRRPRHRRRLRHRGRLRRDRGGVRRQLCRPVGQGGRRDGRGDRAAALGRALLRGHRAVRGRAPRPAGAARPRRLHLLQGGGRRARRRRVRARGEAVGLAARAAPPVRVPAPRGGLGALLDPDGQRDPARPGARAHRDPQVLQRSRVVHPGQPVHPGRGARGRELLRRRGVQLRRHRLGGRRRPRAGGVDRRGGADQRPDQRGHPPLRAVQRQRALAARPRRRGARPALRDPVAQPRDAHRAAVPPLAGAPPAGRGERQLRQPDGLGAGQLLRPCRGSLRRSTTPGASRTGCPGRPPSRPAPAPASRSSTRPRSRSTSSAGRTPCRRCSGCAPPTSTCRSAERSTRECSTRAGPTSPT